MRIGIVFILLQSNLVKQLNPTQFAFLLNYLVHQVLSKYMVFKIFTLFLENFKFS
jgi:hypothetical protein